MFAASLLLEIGCRANPPSDHAKLADTPNPASDASSLVRVSEEPNQTTADVPTDSAVTKQALSGAIGIHRAVVAGYPTLKNELTGYGLTVTTLFGDENQPPQRLVIAFGPKASLDNIRTIVFSVRWTDPVYVGQLSDNFVPTAILIGAEGGNGQTIASVSDVASELKTAQSVAELLQAIATKGKPYSGGA